MNDLKEKEQTVIEVSRIDAEIQSLFSKIKKIENSPRNLTLPTAIWRYKPSAIKRMDRLSRDIIRLLAKKRKLQGIPELWTDARKDKGFVDKTTGKPSDRMNPKKSETLPSLVNNPYAPSDTYEPIHFMARMRVGLESK